MIIRVFRPTIHSGKEREFEAFLRDAAVPFVSQQPGLVAQYVGRPQHLDRALRNASANYFPLKKGVRPGTA